MKTLRQTLSRNQRTLMPMISMLTPKMTRMLMAMKHYLREKMLQMKRWKMLMIRMRMKMKKLMQLMTRMKMKDRTMKMLLQQKIQLMMRIMKSLLRKLSIQNLLQ